MNWTTSATVVPNGEVATAPYEAAFPSWANPASLHIVSGGSVELQRRDDIGTWETFETVMEPASEIAVANSPAIRINPVAGPVIAGTGADIMGIARSVVQTLRGADAVALLKITGTWDDDDTLTATVDGAGAQLTTYQWQEFDGATWLDISGATAETYVQSGVSSAECIRCLGTISYALTSNTLMSRIAPRLSFVPQALTSGGSMEIDLSGMVNNGPPITWTVNSGPATVFESVLTLTDEVGLFTINLTATNSAGSDTADLSVTINAAATAPVLMSPIPDKALDYGDADVTVDLDTVFTGATSYASDHAHATVSGSTLTIDAVAVVSGETVTITASNVIGDATDEFILTVGAVAPTFVIDDQSVTTGVGPFTLDLSTYMTDDGGDASITYGLTTMAGVLLAGSTLTFTDTEGTYSGVEVTATNSGGTTTDTFDFVVTSAAVTVPDAFIDANWSIATGSAPYELDITIASLPSDGGVAITDIEYDVDASGTWVPLGTTTTGTETVTMAAVGTSYAIRLRAANSVGNATAGNSESVTSGAATAPAQFGTGDWSVVDEGSGGTVTVTVSALPSANGSAITDIEYQVDAGSWTSSGTSTTGTFDIGSLIDDVEADIAIRAVNSVGNGTASATKASTPTTAVSVPTFAVPNITRTTGGDMTVDLSIYMTADGGDASITYGLTTMAGVSLTGSVLTFTDSVGTYSAVEVTATNSGGTTTDTFDFTVAATSGLDLVDNVAGVTISEMDNGNGTWTITLTPAYNGVSSKVITQTEIDAGLPILIAEAVITESPTETYTASPGLWGSPQADAAVVTQSWLENNMTVVGTGSSYTNGNGNVLLRYIEHAENIESGAAGVDQTTFVRDPDAAMAADTSALFWFNDEGVTADGSNVITAWADSTGNGNDLAPVGSLPAPTWNAAEGRAEFVKTGTAAGHGLKSVGNEPLGDVLVDSAGSVAFFLVMMTSSNTEDYGQIANSYNTPIGETSGASINPGYGLQGTVNVSFDTAAYGLRAYGPGGQITAAVNISPSTIGNQKIILEVKIDQTDARIYVNGALRSTSTHTEAPATGYPTGMSLGLGGFINGSTGAIANPFAGEIYEVFATSDTSDANRLAVRGELAAWHGIILA